VIRAPGVSGRNVYIQSATLNGKRYDKSFLLHEDLMHGGELVFQMGSQPNFKWGTGRGNEPVSRIDGPQIVPVPVIKAGGQSFRNRLEVNLIGDTPIHYTLDGSEPDSNSAIFTNPIVIEADATVKARAIAADGRRSQVATAKFHSLPHDWRITLESKYSSQYTGGGDFALIDGIRGTTNWSGGAWQGYWEKDFVALIDLGDVQSVSQVGAGFLQDIGSWIRMPRRVEIELSTDGKTFGPALSIANDISDKQEGVVTKDFVTTIPPHNARYIRIRAANSGKDTWIFVDEITIATQTRNPTRRPSYP
jgi:hypothetical protein